MAFGRRSPNVVAALSKQGASKLDDWVILAVSIEGTVRNGVGDSIKNGLLSIIRANITATRRSGITGWTTCLESGIKHVGKRPSEDCILRYLPGDVARPECAIRTETSILAKRFGIRVRDTHTSSKYEETIPHNPRDFGRSAVL